MKFLVLLIAVCHASSSLAEYRVSVMVDDSLFDSSGFIHVWLEFASGDPKYGPTYQYFSFGKGGSSAGEMANRRYDAKLVYLLCERDYAKLLDASKEFYKRSPKYFPLISSNTPEDKSKGGFFNCVTAASQVLMSVGIDVINGSVLPKWSRVLLNNYKAEYGDGYAYNCASKNEKA